jgi:hypothetical protein
MDKYGRRFRHINWSLITEQEFYVEWKPGVNNGNSKERRERLKIAHSV